MFKYFFINAVARTNVRKLTSKKLPRHVDRTVIVHRGVFRVIVVQRNYFRGARRRFRFIYKTNRFGVFSLDYRDASIEVRARLKKHRDRLARSSFVVRAG